MAYSSGPSCLEHLSGSGQNGGEVEDAGGLGDLLAQQLIAAREKVLDVPPKWAGPGPAAQHRRHSQERPQRRPLGGHRGVAVSSGAARGGGGSPGVMELPTHSWDVAAAIERTDLLDHDLGVAALDCARASINPAFRDEQGVPFGPEVESPSNATSWESLAASNLMGRPTLSTADRTGRTLSGSPKPLSPSGAQNDGPGYAR